MICSFGSEPLPSAPDRVFLDSGVFCAVLGVTHPLCRLPDRLYFEALSAFGGVSGLLGKPPKITDWAKKFARGFWGAAWEDAAQNGLRPSQFCQFPRPPEPDEITYLDLVAFLLGEDDRILAKIFDWWKFQIWGDYCRCNDSPPISVVGSTQASPISWPAPPPVQVCGGLSVVTPSAIANAFAPLVAAAQSFFDFTSERLAAEAEVIAQLQASPPLIEDRVNPLVFDMPYSGVLRKISPYFVEETFPFPTGPLPRTTLIPPEQTATASWPGVRIQAIWWPRSTEKTTAFQWRQFALTDLVPPPGSGFPPIPAGTTLSLGDLIAGTGNLIISWYFRVFLQGGGCPQGGSSSWTSWIPGPDPDSDDSKLCRDVRPLCKVFHPACPCHGRPEFTITLQDIENLAQILPPITPQEG